MRLPERSEVMKESFDTEMDASLLLTSLSTATDFDKSRGYKEALYLLFMTK